MISTAPVSPRIRALLDKRLRTNKSGTPFNTERTRLYTDYYKAHENQYPVKKRAGALYYWAQNKTVTVADEDIFAGGMSADYRSISFNIEWGTKWLEDSMSDTDERFRAAWQYPGGSFISDTDRAMLLDAALYWKNMTYTALAEGIMPEGVWGLAGNGINGIPGKGAGISSLFQGHYIGNFDKVVNKGFGAVRREAMEQLDALNGRVFGDDGRKYVFYEGVVTICDAAILFSKRHADACRRKAHAAVGARKTELLRMAESLDWIMEKPARTYWEALQAMLFYEMLLCADAQQHGQSMGRVDQYAGRLLEKELKEGSITTERAQELTDAFMLRINDLLLMHGASNDMLCAVNKEGRYLVSTLAPAMTSTGGLAITIGGVDKDGNDATLQSTYMILQSLLRLGLADPTTALRIHDNTPEDLWALAIEASKVNGGLPQFQNDNLIIPMLKRRGRSPEHARDYGIVGCAEPTGCGNEWPCCGGNGNNSGFCNEGNLLFAIHGGVHPVTGAKGLPCKKLYEYESFDELKNEVERQGKYFLDWHMTVTNFCEIVFAENFPAVAASALLDGCMESGKDATLGGALYNQSSFCAMGTANLADGLMAIKKLCFDEKRYTLKYFYDALCADWRGYEELRQVIRNDCPHYGNGDPEVDTLAEWSLRYYAEYLNTHDCPRGKFCGGTFTVTMHVFQGFSFPATPDGRYAGMPLADAISPVQGLDVNGPVAYMASASKLPHSILYNGDQLNIRFSPSVLQGDGTEKLRELIETYFDLGGMQVQFNVVGTDTLLNAQKNPDDYQSLVVRIAGFSAYFTELAKPVQDDFITRTAQMI
jgi:formate C-acetyltransferase